MDREMRQQLSCSVCLDLYTNPVLLPCLHSLCQQCVHDILQAAIIECPECRTSVSPSGGKVRLKKNFPLDSLVQIYKRAESEKSLTPPSRNIYPDISSLAVHAEIQGQANTGTTTSTHRQIQDSTTRSINDQINQRTTSETAQIAANREKVCSTCDPGSASRATVYCSTCTMSFCTACLHSLHPQDSDHEFLSVAELNKISLCVICEATATDRCLQCKMAFCTPCLASYHPTTISGQGHTLMKVKVKVNSYRLTPKDIPPPLPPRTYSKPLPKRPKQLPRPASTGDNSLSTPGFKRFASLEIARDVREATQDRHCRFCEGRRKVEAVFRCLDCCLSICRDCVFTHRQDAPSHTLINIAMPGGRGQRPVSLDSQQQVLAQRALQTESPMASRGHSSNNIQRQLVDLMGTRSDVMGELMETLNYRTNSEA